MSRNVMEKLANSEQLDEEDVRYATDRGIALPEEYNTQVSQFQQEVSFGTPVGGPVVQGGSLPQPQQQMGPGLFLSEDALESLSVSTLHEVAEAAGVEVTARKKADVVAQLAGAEDTNTEEAPEEGQES